MRRPNFCSVGSGQEGPNDCYSFFVKKTVNVAIVIATVGGLLGLGGSAALTSDQSVIAEVPIAISSSDVGALFVDNLQDRIVVYKNSQDKTDRVRFEPSVKSGIFQLRGPSGAENALLALGDRLWVESRAAAINQAEHVISTYRKASKEFCSSPRCQVQLGLGEIERLDAMSKASEYIPENLPDSLSFSSVGNGPSSAVVLAAGTGIGAALGGLTGWFIASSFRRNRA